MFTSLINTKKGFTLIELLVVIAIIGILSSVVMTSLSTARAKARDAKRVSGISQIQTALELYFDVTQTYPSSSPNCDPACARPTDTDEAIQMLAQKNYFTQPLIPPPGGSDFFVYKGVYVNSGTLTECTAVGTVCTGYSFGITLERNDNVVLTTDADRTLGTVFYGASQDCVTAPSGAPELCYDFTK